MPKCNPETLPTRTVSSHKRKDRSEVEIYVEEKKKNQKKLNQPPLSPPFGCHIYHSQKLHKLLSFTFKLTLRNRVPHRAQVIHHYRVLFLTENHRVNATAQWPRPINLAPLSLNIIKHAVLLPILELSKTFPIDPHKIFSAVT